MGSFISFVSFVASNAPTLYVHNGVFHADDVVAAAVIKTLVPDTKVIRTRDLPDAAVFAVDVGGDACPYDHHGPSVPKWEKFETPHCGVSRLLEDADVAHALCDIYCMSQKAYDRFLRDYIVPIAKLDNGVQLEAGQASPWAAIHSFNPTWVEGMGDQDAAFEKAVSCARLLLEAFLRKAKADEAAEAALTALPLDQKVVPIPAGLPGWQAVLAPAEATFVTFQSEGQTWVQAVPLSVDEPFSQKIRFPQAWGGLRGAELDAVAGTASGVFCHPAGFLGIWRESEDAEKAIQQLLK